MHYLITTIAGILSALFLIAVGWSIYFTFTDNPYWVFVAVGFLLPTIVLVLITGASYSAVKEY